MPISAFKLSLIIGNKNYSSWSLRGWLALHAFGVDFEEVKLELFSEEFKQTLAIYNANDKVPLLIDNNKAKGKAEGEAENREEENRVVWDSLAIAEYIAEHYAPNAWGKHKALARCLVCEMHSGFFAIRNEMPMNIKATRKIAPSDVCFKDMARINQIFTQYRKQFKHEGNYLLGAFSIADAFYAPVVFRLATYAKHSGIMLDEEAQSYCDNLLNHPSMVAWKQQALLETNVVEEDEAGEEV